MNKLAIDKFLEGELDMALKRRAKMILLGLDIKSGEKILDAACGPGYYLKLIKKMGVKKISLFGIDIDRKTIEYSKKETGGLGIKLFVGDIRKMPFKSNYFDKVVASEVIEHISDDKKALDEIYRVLKPKGVVVLTVPNKRYPMFWDPVNWMFEKIFNKHIEFGSWSGLWANHLRLYERIQLSSLMIKVGFKIKEEKAYTRWCIPFNHNLLYGGRLSKKSSEKILSKVRGTNKPVIIKIILSFLNTLDKLNDYFPNQDIGVGVYVKAEKIKK